MTVYNFAAGPSTLPKQALLIAQKELLDYKGTGISVMEMSHRSKPYQMIHDECKALFKELLNIPDNYKLLFMTGGATTQFEAIPLNLLNNSGKADYMVTGNFAEKAFKFSKKYGDTVCALSSKDKNFTYIPTWDNNSFREDIDYLHVTSNNTIFGTKFNSYPKVAAPLVVDMSSNILSEEFDVNQFGLIYAGAQKNIAPAGITLVIVREDLIGNPLPTCPVMFDYKTFADNDSMSNTPPTFVIYMALLTLKWIKSLGGISAINKMNIEKSSILYDFIDNSKLFTNSVQPDYRSLMNVPFVTPSKELDAEFLAQATVNGLITLKGHKLVGGMRASIYNAMPIEGVKSLINFMKKFELANS